MTTIELIEYLKDFIQNYTTLVLQYIDADNVIYFSSNLVDFSLDVSNGLKLYKREFDTSGDYILKFEIEGEFSDFKFSKILNEIDYLVLTNSIL